MSTYVIIGKQHICPVWDCPVTINGKYRYSESGKPYVANFISCSCPILDNIALPKHDQNKEYSFFGFVTKVKNV